MTPPPKLTPKKIDEAIRLPNGSLPCGIGTTREHAVNAARAIEAARDQQWIEMLAGQEPVAWIWKYANGEEEVVFVPPRHIDATYVDAPSTITPLYTAPQPPQQPTEWVGLTEDDVINIGNEVHRAMLDDADDQQELLEIYKEIEAKLREKNGGAK